MSDVTCLRCHVANPASHRFCAQCGAALGTTCRVCGSPSRPQSRSCARCGSDLLVGNGLAARARPTGELLVPGAAAEGERKLVTVLFVDVQNSMDVAEQLDAEAWRLILDQFLAILASGVQRFQGTVSQTTGDGIVAVFGAPVAQEDHAQRACQAVLHLAESIRRYADELRLGRGLNFSVRFGLDSGEVVVARTGDDRRIECTVDGPAVGLAARMQQIAAPDRAYLTEHTASLVQGFFRLRDLGQLMVKGERSPVRVHELLGVGPVRSRLEMAKLRGFSRFVGREEERGTFERALARVVGGSGQIIGIGGEPGVGKSRLCYELAQGARARGIEVHEAHCLAHTRMTPFAPIADLLRSLFGIDARHDTEDSRRKIAGTVLLLDPEITFALPPLFDLLGVAGPEHDVPRIDPDAWQRQLEATVVRLVATAGRRIPQVIVVDDLQWIDRASDVLLGALMRELEAIRVLMLVTFRPEYDADWMRRGHYRPMQLRPLPETATDELLSDILGPEVAASELTRRIRDRAAGNPYFVEELVRGLVEAGHLAGGRGAYTLPRPVDAVDIPSTLQAVIAARLDRLDDTQKHLLQVAAVIGKRFDEAVVLRAAGASEAAARPVLRGLIDAGFLYEEGLPPDVSFTFSHPMLQEVAYRSQLEAARTERHRDVALALSSLGRDRADQLAALLAFHWEAAGDVVEAARWNRRAGEWLGRSSIEESAGHWRRVRELLQRAPDTPELAALRIDAGFRLLNLGWRLGLSRDEAQSIFAEARALAHAGGDLRAADTLLASLVTFESMSGAAGESLARAEEAARRAIESQDTDLLLILRGVLVFARYASGHLLDALALAEEALSGPPPSIDLGARIAGFSPYLFLIGFRGLLLAETGQLAAGSREIERVILEAEHAGEHEVLGWGHLWRGLVHRAMGDAEGALASAERAVDLAERMGSSLSCSQAYNVMGLARSMRLEWDEAVTSFERSLAVIRQRGAARWSEPAVVAGLAEARLGARDEHGALEAAQQALELSRRFRARALECGAQLTLARVLLRTRGRSARPAIAAALDDALALVAETGARALEPSIRIERAALADLIGDPGAAAHERHLADQLRMAMGTVSVDGLGAAPRES